MNTILRPEPLNGILDIIPYKGGDSKIAGFDKVYKLSSNENPLGYSDSARAAYLTWLDKIAAYPDGGHIELKNAIANRFGLDAERIVCGNGSDEIFQLLGRAYLNPDDEIIQSEYGFLVYRLVAQQAGAKCLSAKTNEYVSSVDAMLALVSEKTKIVFLDNPNNPCGTYLPFEEIKRLHAGLPRNVLLVLDAAYAEYVYANDYSSGLELASEFENVIMTRTFSKIYGLAALRIGWAYGAKRIIDAINRVRSPFNITGPSLSAAAAAMNDASFTQASAEHNKKWLDILDSEFKALGLKTIPSVANFIMIDFLSIETADKCDEYLKSNGIIVRKIASYNLPNCLRISVGTEEANIKLIKVMQEFALKKVS